VVASVQLSTAPEASTPSAYSPALQLAPLAAKAVAVEIFPVIAPVNNDVPPTYNSPEAFKSPAVKLKFPSSVPADI